ncbi:gamma-glutamyl hydrolase [Latimeria chalumnae]|uniref:folate gamma-glutamyl hydrolase n=1 Tax=Latimeria chalumnae TaxID=7897 RepID=H2ZYJ2_LATCH|nr:PREDICTED: gamma-glutamyl hydrolase-like [Latimeria chalumnae]|eukprot:XP_006012487.1 PREDICTED: gamma-glutamyl hydrolase-like [Latimeria chalumnae]
MVLKCFVFSLSTFLFFFLSSSANNETLNYRPIIGIPAQGKPPSFNFTGETYLAASYVKFVESAGGRVVPVKMHLSYEEYENLFHSINGVLLPGGGVHLNDSEYARVSKIFYNLALKANDKGDYFPMLGICLGFEELSFLTGGKNVLIKTKTNGLALPLNFTIATNKSKMFKGLSKELLKILTTENVTSNFHRWSLSVETFRKNEKLHKFYKILTTNTDGKIEFISSMEAYRYPVYAVQWHPEKNPFEWIVKRGMVHTPQAIKVSFYMADFFINEARKNVHKFSSEAEEDKALIYNYAPVYSGDRFPFEQVYIFD